MIQKIGVFVDVQNIYYTTRDTFQKSFNYRALWQQLEETGELVMAKAYATDRGDDKQRRFQDALRGIGFDVKLKPFIQRRDGSAKGDWDVGITIDVMEAAADLDKVVLLSGDGDFALLLEHIKNHHGVVTEVYGVPELTAASLIGSASHFRGIGENLLI